MGEEMLWIVRLGDVVGVLFEIPHFVYFSAVTISRWDSGMRLLIGAATSLLLRGLLLIHSYDVYI